MHKYKQIIFAVANRFNLEIENSMPSACIGLGSVIKCIVFADLLNDFHKVFFYIDAHTVRPAFNPTSSQHLTKPNLPIFITIISEFK